VDKHDIIENELNKLAEPIAVFLYLLIGVGFDKGYEQAKKDLKCQQNIDRD